MIRRSDPMKRRMRINLDLLLNGNQAELLRIYQSYYGYRTEREAAIQALLDGLHDFMGTNSGNPDLPELKQIDSDKL